MQCGDVEKLIRKRGDPTTPPLYFVAVEDMFDIIHRAHLATGHGGRDRMLKDIGRKYANIPKQAVGLYKKHCEECQKKHKRPKVKGVVVNPILTADVLSRCQVDLIDMQSLPSGDFKWILVYQDHFSKYVLLRPLTSKRAAEVAHQLVDIFLTFGAPAILHSDNGSEFTAKVISDIAKLWPTLKLVNGKPRHPQSQGSVERANGDIKDMLVAWMNDNRTTEWSWGLKFVQFMKNSSHHAGIGHTPFKAMFGVDVKVGLQSTPLPDEIVQMISTEEELEQVAQLQQHHRLQHIAEPEQATLFPSSVVTEPDVFSGTGYSSPATDHATSHVDIVHTFNVPLPSDQTSMTVHTLGFVAVEGVAGVSDEAVAGVSVDSHLDKVRKTRKRTQQATTNQAERMLKRSRTNLMAADKSDSVMIPIPLVDRGRGDPRNIIAIVLNRNENDMYKLGVRKGVLKGRYSRNQFDVCQEHFLSEESVDFTKTLSLREAVISESLGGGQGFIKCNCLGEKGRKCATNKCKCFKNKLKCNSRCHGSLTCKNK